MSCELGTRPCRRGAGGGGCGDAIDGGVEGVLVLQHSNLVELVMHNSVVVHESLDVHDHRVRRLLNELLLPWHTLEPICRLGLQVGVVLLLLLVGLGLVV